MSDYDDLLTDDQDWLRSFSASLKILEDWSCGQLALWSVDDLLGTKRYVACPRRGLHARVVDCWMCWCDVAWGYAHCLGGARGRGGRVVAPGPIAVHDDLRAYCRVCDYVSPVQPDEAAADVAATEHIEQCHPEIEDC